MPPRRNYSAEKRALLEKAAAIAAVPQYDKPAGPEKPRPNQYFERHQDEIDAKAHPDSDVGFVHQPNGQMYMTEGTTMEHKLPDTVQVEHDDGSTSTHHAGVESEPYATRPAPQGKQLALGKSGAFRPTDPALHNIRQQNPHLNDYDFQVQGTQPHQIHTVTAIHTPTDTHAGALSWKGKEYAERHHPGEGRAGEVEMVEVKDQHRGRGLSSALWDYAHHQASRDGSEIAHPVHSDNRSIEGNHWAHFVGGAAMARTKGFGVKAY